MTDSAAMFADASKSADPDNIREVVEKEFGSLDVLFVNAGVAVSAALERTVTVIWSL
jgi:NAD(P)-dependent dehydrogenase (short-subunit alcohol dehydrogenase family)